MSSPFMSFFSSQIHLRIWIVMLLLQSHTERYEANSRNVDNEASSVAKATIKTPPGSHPSSPESLPDITSTVLKFFNYQPLQASTMNFHSSRLLGRGLSGDVFKGWIDPLTRHAVRAEDGVAIAIKKFESTDPQSHREWLLHVNKASEWCHPNIAKVLGYCINGDTRFLVCRYMPEGSLAGVLFDEKKKTLSWERRVHIALNAAYALKYLHESQPQIVYGDLKSTSILLDYDYTAKLSGFGFVKPDPINSGGDVPNQVGRILGYTAPEYLETGLLTLECDIYSFGVVLLELLTGRPSIDLTKYGDESNLVIWLQPLSHDTRILNRFMDPRLGGNFPSKSAYLAIMLGLQCTGEARLRPSPSDIITTIGQFFDQDGFHDAHFPLMYEASASESESVSPSSSTNAQIVHPPMLP